MKNAETKSNTKRFAVTCKCCKKHWTAVKTENDIGRDLYEFVAESHACERFEAYRARELVAAKNERYPKRVRLSNANHTMGCSWLKIDQITHNPRGSQHKCDDRCYFAEGHMCKCECGGKHHGKGNELIAA